MWRSGPFGSVDCVRSRACAAEKIVLGLACSSETIANPAAPGIPLSCKFANRSQNRHIIATAFEDGTLYLSNTRGSRHRAVQQFMYETDTLSDGSALFQEISWSHNDEHIGIACKRGRLLIVDTDTGKISCSLGGHSRVSKVKAVRFLPTNPCKSLTFLGNAHIINHPNTVRSDHFHVAALVLSACNEGKIALHDLRSACPETQWYSGGREASFWSSETQVHITETPVMHNPFMSKPLYRSTEGSGASAIADIVAFDHFVCSGGASDGCVQVWDLRHINAKTAKSGNKRSRADETAFTCAPITGIHLRTALGKAIGISNMDFNLDTGRLLVNTTTSRVLLYDLSATLLGLGSAAGMEKSVFDIPESAFPSAQAQQAAHAWDVTHRPEIEASLRLPHIAYITPPRSTVRRCKSQVWIHTSSPDRRHLAVDPAAWVPQQLTGHASNSFRGRAYFSPCGTFVASNSEDMRTYVWKVLRHGTGEEASLPLCVTEVASASLAWGGERERPQLVTASVSGSLVCWTHDLSTSAMRKAVPYMHFVEDDVAMHMLTDAVHRNPAALPTIDDIYWTLDPQLRRRHRPRGGDIAESAMRNLVQGVLTPVQRLDTDGTEMHDPPTVTRERLEVRGIPNFSARSAPLAGHLGE